MMNQKKPISNVIWYYASAEYHATKIDGNIFPKSVRAEVGTYAFEGKKTEKLFGEKFPMLDLSVVHKFHFQNFKILEKPA